MKIVIIQQRETQLTFDYLSQLNNNILKTVNHPSK